jgi:hypothetical protein
MKRGLLVGAAALLAGAALTGCSTYAPADSIILYYNSGTGENKEWAECIAPGKSGSYPIDDEIFQIPTSLRTWNIRPEGGDSKDPIRSGTLPVSLPATSGSPGINQPGPEVVVWATADFYINTDCSAGKESPVVKFWENSGRRYEISADGEDGFNIDKFRGMLLNTLVPAEEKAIREETRKYSGDDLDANLNGVWAQMERNLAPSFLAELKAKLGGDYFCGIGYQGGKEVSWKEWVADGTDEKGQPKIVEKEKKGSCPPVRITITDVNFADPAIAAARTRVFTEKQNAEADQIKAQSERDRAATLGQAVNTPGYVELQKIEVQKQAAAACQANPNCTVIIDGTGNANVNTGTGRR